MEANGLEAQIDELYQVPPSDFVSKRNLLVKQLKSSGLKEEAERVKKLSKPTVTAWAVNRCFGAHQSKFRAAVEAGSAVRSALAGTGSTQEAMAARRSAIDALTRTAEAELTRVGGKVGPDTLRRIGRTIEALVTAPGDDVIPGRLAHDLEPPGFEAVMGMALSASPEPTKRGTKKRKKPGPSRKSKTADKARTSPPRKSGARASAAREKASEAELRAARSKALRALREAESLLESVARRRATAERAVDRTTRALTAAKAEMKRAGEAARDASSQLKVAKKEEAKVMAQVAGARQALDDLPKG